jgi:antitoxin (DNA-binding transcriptional repressor) of toxin-antitoxin stability system
MGPPSALDRWGEASLLFVALTNNELEVHVDVSQNVSVKYKSKPAKSSIIQETPLTMVELRKNAAQVMRGLRKGVKYRFTYRGKTVGWIVPATEDGQEIPKDDAIFRLHEFVGDGPAGRLDNEEIDRLVYGL